jgi:hypothetical protein
MRKVKRSARLLCLFGNWYRPNKQYWERAYDHQMALEKLFKDFIGPALVAGLSRNSALWERFYRPFRPLKMHVG